MSVLNPAKFGTSHLSWSSLGRSVLATLALGLALGCALASSSAAQEGNVVTAIVLAALSLILAIVISVTVVPRLALRVRQEWPRLSFSMTREGWLSILSLVVLALAAFNTGNNLIFVIFSATLATLIVSEFISSINFRRLNLRVQIPEVINAREPFLFVVSLYNRKKWIPSFSILVEGQEFGSNSKGNDKRRIFRQGHYAQFSFVAAGNQSRLSIPLQLDHRGQYTQPKISISSRFPFGFVEKTRLLAIDQDLVVLPEIQPPEEFLELLPLLNGAWESHYRGWGTDLHSIRDYSIRDSARFLDWKATAKTGRLQVREFTREDDRQCCFVFDNIFSDFQESDRLGFEKSVTLCANAARHFHYKGIEIRLVTPGASTAFSKSREGLLAILNLLALIEPVLGSPYSFSEVSSEMAFKVLFTPHRRGTIPTRVWNSSQVFYMNQF